MSFCTVGNVLIPPNENAIVPKANDSDRKVGCSCGVVSFSDKFAKVSAKMIIAPTAVADIAPTATGLKCIDNNHSI